VPRTDETLPFDEAIADATAVVRALIIDDDQRSAREPSNRDRASAIASRDDAPHRHEPELVELRAAVVRVVAQLVENLRVDRSHETHATCPV
jgi:hypothetical protein